MMDIEEGKTTLLVSKRLHNLFNKCATKIRVALNKQDDLIVSHRFRSILPPETITGQKMDCHFDAVEFQTLAARQKDGSYNILTKSFISATANFQNADWLKIPGYCVNDFSAGDGYVGLSKEEAIGVLRNFEAEIVENGLAQKSEHAPDAALHYSLHLKK